MVAFGGPEPFRNSDSARSEYAHGASLLVQVIRAEPAPVLTVATDSSLARASETRTRVSVLSILSPSLVYRLLHAGIVGTFVLLEVVSCDVFKIVLTYLLTWFKEF